MGSYFYLFICSWINIFLKTRKNKPVMYLIQIDMNSSKTMINSKKIYKHQYKSEGPLMRRAHPAHREDRPRSHVF